MKWHKNILSTITISKKAQNNSFVLASTNLSQFLPKINKNKHKRIVKEILYHQKLTWNQQSNLSVIKKCKIKGYKIDESIEPSIFCSFHLGVYRLNLSYLLYKKIPVSLVASSEVIRKQKNEIINHYKNITGKEDFVIINSESSTSLLQMARELKNGRSLFIYIDGNSGVGGISREKGSMLKTKFFNRPIFVRKGVAFLSHFTKTRIILMMSYRKCLINNIQIYNPIYPSLTNEREKYCIEKTNYIYSLFSEYLKKYYKQWEGWFYIHKYLDTKSLNSNYREEIVKEKKHYQFNKKRYDFIFIDKDIYLFDRYTYLSYKIDSDNHKLLTNRRLLRNIDTKEFYDFIQLKILH